MENTTYTLLLIGACIYAGFAFGRGVGFKEGQAELYRRSTIANN